MGDFKVQAQWKQFRVGPAKRGLNADSVSILGRSGGVCTPGKF